MRNAVSLILSALVLFSGCGGVSVGVKIKLLGNFGPSYTYSVPIARADGEVAIDKIWITPLYGGDPNRIASQYMGEHIQFLDITSGSFNVGIDTDVSEDWLILLIDSTKAAKKDQVIAYVTMGLGDDNMIKIPAGDASGDEIDFGTLDDNGNGEAVNSNSAATNEAFFELSPANLLAIAKTDDMLKAVKNIYINYNSSTGYFYHAMPIFNFKSGTISSLIDAAPSAAAAASIVSASNRMYHFIIKTNAGPWIDSDETPEDNPPATVTLVPPENITIGSWDGITTNVYGPTGTDGTAIPNTYGYVDHNAPNTPSDQLILGYTYFSGEIAEGYWELRNDSTTLCTFDVSQAFSVDALDNPKIFVPVPSLELDASRNITKITITWYMYDSTTSPYYTAVTDTTILESTAAGSLYLQISENNDNISLPFAQTEITSTAFNGTHNVDTLIANPAYSIVLNYVMNGVTFRFVWTQ